MSAMSFDAICRRIVLVSAFAALAPATPALAAPLSLTYDSFIESKTITTPLPADSTLRVEGSLANATSGTIRNSLTFVPGASSVSIAAGWLVAPTSNRTVAFGVDLYDFNGNLVVSDTFQGVNGALATSLLTANVIAGARYELVVTGLADESGRYALNVTSGATAPAIAALAVTDPPTERVVFDTHVGSKTLGTALAVGGALVIDGTLVDDLLGDIDNRLTFRNLGTNLSAGIEWIVGQPGNPQRTTAFNVDLVNSFGATVASDVFQGLQGEQAFSQLLALGVGPGDYSLRFTGFAPFEGRFRLRLGTGAVAPGFDPIVDGPGESTVPEPGLLVMAGIGLVVAMARERVKVRRAKRANRAK